MGMNPTGVPPRRCLLYYELTTTSGWSHQNTVLVGVPDNLTASLQACKIGLSETYRARVRRRRSTYSSNVNSPASANTGPIGGYVHSPHTNRGRPLARASSVGIPGRAVVMLLLLLLLDVVVVLDVLDHMMSSCATAANVCPLGRVILGGSSSNEWFSLRKHVFFHTQACGDVGIAHPQGAQIVCQAGDICSVSNPCQNTRSVSK